MKVFIPPIKSQGIKSKLVEWIYSSTDKIAFERWVEPFMGTGVVAFNIRPKKALLCDSNPHIINFYNAIKNKEITSKAVKRFLTTEGQKLLESEGAYYYEVRDRFNQTSNPLDFLFLSRACFNGMMRFNKKGGFNVPFCKKPNRFAQALVTKIANQVENISRIIDNGDYTFINQDFQDTIKNLQPTDFVYSDPPYIGRHVDYFDSWTEEDEKKLKAGLSQTNVQFLLSTWLSNKYRTNEYIFTIWKDCFLTTKEHFYHVGAKETNRNAVYEALLSNIRLSDSITSEEMAIRINSNESRLTSMSKKLNVSKQLILILEENQNIPTKTHTFEMHTL